MVWQGKDAYKVGRQLLGATKPSDSAPGTIRFDFAVDVGRNLCHGSDSNESAEAEIKLWFTPEETSSWECCTHTCTAAQHKYPLACNTTEMKR
jgi:nucleoside-diphosphate kinase